MIVRFGGVVDAVKAAASPPHSTIGIGSDFDATNGSLSYFCYNFELR